MLRRLKGEDSPLPFRHHYRCPDRSLPAPNFTKCATSSASAIATLASTTCRYHHLKQPSGSVRGEQVRAKIIQRAPAFAAVHYAYGCIGDYRARLSSSGG